MLSLKEVIKMAIKEYFKLEANGKKKRLYMVTAEAINKYTGQRRAKKRRGILSKPKAEMIYKEIWSLCRNEKPDGPEITLWGQLMEKYLTDVEGQIRSPENPTGFSPQVIVAKRGHFKRLEHWNLIHLDLITPHFANKELDTLERHGVASRSLTRNILKNMPPHQNLWVNGGSGSLPSV